MEKRLFMFEAEEIEKFAEIILRVLRVIKLSVGQA